MQDDQEQPHLPGVDASKANDESVLRVHAQLRRERKEGSPIAFFTAFALIIVFVFAWFYQRRYFAEYDSASVLHDREDIAAMQAWLERPREPAAPVVLDGGALYASNACVGCHQGNGQGVPGAFPPLAGSEWVTGAPELPVKILLAGLSGPITVKGNPYNGAMPAYGHLNDAEIAAIVSYIRSEWGNEASEVTAEQVATIRADVGSRGNYSAEDLAEYF